MRAQYKQNMEQLENAQWLQLQVPHASTGGEPGPGEEYAPGYPGYEVAPWGGDPGIYVEPTPEWEGDPGIFVRPETGFEGDPGIEADPPYVAGQLPDPRREWQDPGIWTPPAQDLDRPRGVVLAPSIVPGLDWITGGPYHEIGPRRVPDTAPVPEMAPSEPARPLTTSDYISEGAKGFLLPSLVGGTVAGVLAAASARGSGLGGLLFAQRVIGNVALGVATGAGAGLLVAATSPKAGDDLAARYAVAGGLLGAVGGAAFPGGTSRAFSAALGAVSGAIVAGFTGSRIERH
jgi:hypothetical protein